MTTERADDRYARLLHRLTTGEAARAQAEIQIELVKDQILSAERIAEAANEHAAAAARSAVSLKQATWILSVATGILAIATVVLVYVTATHG